MDGGQCSWADSPAVEDVARQLKALLFPAVAGIAVRSVDVDIENVRLDVQCTTAGGACPGCGVCSTRVHSSYLRFLADVPSAGRSVVLQLRVRRFRCGNTKCPRRTFVEQISGLTRRARPAHRTTAFHPDRRRPRPGWSSRRPPGCRARHVRQPEHGLAPGRGAARAGGADASGGRRR
ncbi:transposase family protein [Streptomyces hydrogenans]|uniref:transposase family protein n=1 Tax=Streptomyces hydrogenans TaxID=1873719 RepID=UPI0035DA06B7